MVFEFPCPITIAVNYGVLRGRKLVSDFLWSDHVLGGAEAGG